MLQEAGAALSCSRVAMVTAAVVTVAEAVTTMHSKGVTSTAEMAMEMAAAGWEVGWEAPAAKAAAPAGQGTRWRLHQARSGTALG